VAGLLPRERELSTQRYRPALYATNSAICLISSCGSLAGSVGRCYEGASRPRCREAGRRRGHGPPEARRVRPFHRRRIRVQCGTKRREQRESAHPAPFVMHRASGRPRASAFYPAPLPHWLGARWPPASEALSSSRPRHGGCVRPRGFPSPRRAPGARSARRRGPPGGSQGLPAQWWMEAPPLGPGLGRALPRGSEPSRRPPETPGKATDRDGS
jgi:hypothetical protein